MKTITYALKDIFLDGKPMTGANAPTIVFESLSPCLSIVCYHPETFQVEVTIDDSIEDCKPCIRYFITYPNCHNCEPKEVVRCFCKGPDDCPDCLICVEGACIEKCPGKVCDPITEDCVDCSEAFPCPCNQVCIQGKCVCPPSKKLNQEGCCVDCLPGDKHPESDCLVCIGGAWATKICTSGVLDPVSCECKECLEPEDCIGDFKCCVSGKCVCCPGYIFDPVTQECIEEPVCNVVEDCPLCYNCVEKDCVPLVCPSGKVAVPNILTGTCDCLSPCDCDDPQSCENQLHICTDRNNDGLCNCYSCDNNPCDENTPCEKGCICIGGMCIKNPCGQSCEDGPCPPGCGCVDGICIPCHLLSCFGLECSQAAGCKCTGNGNCEASTCIGPCDNPDDCGKDCGCLDNSCVECSNYSCENSPCPDGCICIQGTCVKNPCNQKTCETGADCGLNCGCYQGICVPCNNHNCADCAKVNGCICETSFCEKDDNPKVCEDRFEWVKDGCSTKLELETEHCCACDAIAYKTVLSKEDNTDTDYEDYNLEVTLLDHNGVPLGSNNIINDLPITGSIKFNVRDTYEIDSGSGWDTINYIDYKLPATAYTVPFTLTGVNDITIEGNLPIDSNPLFRTFLKLGEVVTITPVVGDPYDIRVVRRQITILEGKEFFFPASTCEYENEKHLNVFTEMLVGTDSVAPVTKNLFRNTPCKRPLFTIYKRDTLGDFEFADIIGKWYATQTSTEGNTNTYSIDFENYPPLEYGRYYMAVSDCGCEPVTYYKCFGLEPTPLIFCNPIDYEMHLENCGLTLVFDKDHLVTCPVYLAVGADKPIYDIYINGVFKETITLGASPSIDNVLIPEGYEITHTSPINLVEIRLRGDICLECEYRKTFELETLDFTGVVNTNPCDFENTSVVINVTGGVSPYIINTNNTEGEADYNETKVSISGVSTFNTFTTPGAYDVVVTDAEGCSRTKEIVIPDVDSIDDSVVVTYSCTPTPRINVVNPFSSPLAIEVTNTDTTTVTNHFAGPNSTLIIPILGVNYSVKATLSIGCVTTKTIVADCCEGGGDLKLTIENTCLKGAPQAAFIYSGTSNQITITGPTGTHNKTFVLQGEVKKASFSGLTNGTYTYTIIENSCPYTGTFEVECYYCDGVDCIALDSSYTTNKELYSEATCGNVCGIPDFEGVIDLSYSCSTGLTAGHNHDVPLGTVYTFYKNEIATDYVLRSPIPSGLYTLQTTIGGTGQIITQLFDVPTCYVCNESVECVPASPNLGYPNLTACQDLCVLIPKELNSNEIMFTSLSGGVSALYKVAVTPTSVGTPVHLCNASGSNFDSIAFKSGTDMYLTTMVGSFYHYDFQTCAYTSTIASLGVSNALGYLNSTTLLFCKTDGKIGSLDPVTNIKNEDFYVFDSNYRSAGDLVRRGGFVFGLFQNKTNYKYVILKFTLTGEAITSFVDLGELPLVGAFWGLALVEGDLYAGTSTGQVYFVNEANPSLSNHIGSLGYPIRYFTNIN